MNVSVTSSSLMRGLFAGKADAWTTMVHLYQPLVLNWCRQSDLQHADALNVSQEVFQAVSKGIQQYQVGVHRFRSWLRGITKNKIKDYYRKLLKVDVARGGSTAQLRFKNIPDSILEEEDINEEQESLILIIQALELIQNSIDEKAWGMTWAFVVEGEPVTDIAGKYHVSVGAVYKAKSRVLSKIRNELQELIE